MPIGIGFENDYCAHFRGSLLSSGIAPIENESHDVTALLKLVAEDYIWFVLADAEKDEPSVL